MVPGASCGAGEAGHWIRVSAGNNPSARPPTRRRCPSTVAITAPFSAGHPAGREGRRTHHRLVVAVNRGLGCGSGTTGGPPSVDVWTRRCVARLAPLPPRHGRLVATRRCLCSRTIAPGNSCPRGVDAAITTTSSSYHGSGHCTHPAVDELALILRGWQFRSPCAS